MDGMEGVARPDVGTIVAPPLPRASAEEHNDEEEAASYSRGHEVPAAHRAPPPGGSSTRRAWPPASLGLTVSPAAGGSKRLSWLDRYLTAWVFLSMVLGVILGHFAPGLRQALAAAQIQTVSLPIALGLWMMMWPILTKVRYESLAQLASGKEMWYQLAVSFVLNWLIGPAAMAAAAWAALPEAIMQRYRGGVILVGLATCIAMVLTWNHLARGDPEYCAVLVAVNSLLQIVLYAPLAIFYLVVVSGLYQQGSNPAAAGEAPPVDGSEAEAGGGSSTTGGLRISAWQVARSVLVFLCIPLAAALLTRAAVAGVKGAVWLDTVFMPWFAPVALLALLYTILIMFALMGGRVLANIGSVARVAVALLLYFAVTFFLPFLFCARVMGFSYSLTVTQALTAASNNFELAIAVAVSTFGIDSPEALAAAIGPLIEVPVMLAFVYFCLWMEPRMAATPSSSRAVVTSSGTFIWLAAALNNRRRALGGVQQANHRHAGPETLPPDNVQSIEFSSTM